MTTTNITPLGSNHGYHTLSQEQARAKLNGYIEERRSRAVGTLEQIRDVVPQDKLIRATGLDFDVNAEGRVEYITPAGVRETLHRNAITQLAGRLDIPVSYVDHLQASAKDGNRWGVDFLAKTLREHTTHSDDRYLVRSVNKEARAFLSDKFRRIDVRPGALNLIEAAQAKGLIVSDGVFTDTRSALKFVKPEPIEVFPGEWMVFGFDWSNSDYGRGASDLRLFLFRLWCWNGAVGESVVRQIHIGRRLQDDVDYAQDTLEADAKASALALRDAAATAMSDAKVAGLIEGIRSANETKIDGKARAEGLKKALTKGEVEQVVEAFNSPDVENLPAGNSLWRWSNAISFVGGQTQDADRKIDFERLAGDVLGRTRPTKGGEATA